MRSYFVYGLSLVFGAHLAVDVAAGGDSEAAAFSARTETEHVASHKAGAIIRAHDGLFYVDADAGEGRVRFLVDTGASHVVLSRADLDKVQLIAKPGPGPKIVTAAGTIAADWVVIAELEVSGHSLHNVTAAVPERDPGISLLGQNALSQFSSMRIEGDRLTLAQEKR